MPEHSIRFNPPGSVTASKPKPVQITPPAALPFSQPQSAIEKAVALQRTVGNQATIRTLARPQPPPKAPTITHRAVSGVQRMPSGDELVAVAGQPKEDKKVLFKTFKMSERYKKVIASLNEYRSDLSSAGIVSNWDGMRTDTGNRLKGKLDGIHTDCQTYLRDHPDDERSPHIQNVQNMATAEKETVEKIKSSTTFVSKKWIDAVKSLEGDTKLRLAMNTGDLQNSYFHGTSSSLLKNFGGEMMTGAELEKRGITTDSGEGDFYSTGGGGAKNFISVGEGVPGMGTANAYAQAVSMYEDYNPALYTDFDLEHEFDLLTKIIVNWDESLNQIPNDDIGKARREKKQFEGLRKKLKNEILLRLRLPPDHPRRKGEDYSDSNYPLLFELLKENLTATNPRPDQTLKDDTLSARPIGGERSVQDQSIDLRIPGRLKRVYCPAQHIEKVRSRLAQILGHSKYDIIPMESFDMLPENMEHTQQLTLDVMATLYGKGRRLILHAYAEAMTTNTPVDKNTLKDKGQHLDILEAMAKGKLTDQEIRDDMGNIAVENVGPQVQKLLTKLGARTRQEAVLIGRQQGLISDTV
jgi:hypothetical protein